MATSETSLSRVPSTPPGSHAPTLPTGGLDELLDAIGAGAAARERDRTPPGPEIRALARAGVGSMRIPAASGGGGASIRELMEFVVRLARADPNIAQSLRAHYHFVEGRLASPDPSQRERWFPLILEGALFGNGTVERHTKEIFGFETTISPAGDHFLLNGTKYYSTGTLYSDYTAVMALDEQGEKVAAIVPVDRDGVIVEDDWDAMGQRLTASGTSRFENVRVEVDEIIRSPSGPGRRSVRTPFLQLYLLAVMAGIASAAATDAAAIARGRKRTFSHGSGEMPASDPLIQQAVGGILADAFACESVVYAAGDALDAAAATGPEGGQDEALCTEAAVQTAKAHVVVAELAPRCAQALFNAGGASATSREANLDRHWRNVRTVASHNPAMYKARALGDLLINGEPLPDNGFI